MKEAASRKDMELFKWPSSKFPECKIASEVVVRACEQGAAEILQFFDRRVLKGKGRHGVGHAVQWGGESMAAAISGRRSDIAWWLYRQFPDAEFYMDAAVVSALKAGDIMVIHWLVANGAGFPNHLNGGICFEEVTGLGRLDVLQSLDEEGKLKGALYLLGTAAENGHLEAVQWLVGNDEKGQLTKLGGEGSVAIHPAAVNGHLDVAKYLRAKVQRPFSTLERKDELSEQNNFYYSASNGHLWRGADKVSWRTMSEGILMSSSGFMQSTEMIPLSTCSNTTRRVSRGWWRWMQPRVLDT